MWLRPCKFCRAIYFPMILEDSEACYSGSAYKIWDIVQCAWRQMEAFNENYGGVNLFCTRFMVACVYFTVDIVSFLIFSVSFWLLKTCNLFACCRTEKEPPSTLLWTMFLVAQVCFSNIWLCIHYQDICFWLFLKVCLLLYTFAFSALR